MVVLRIGKVEKMVKLKQRHVEAAVGEESPEREPTANQQMHVEAAAGEESPEHEPTANQQMQHERDRVQRAGTSGHADCLVRLTPETQWECWKLERKSCRQCLEDMKQESKGAKHFQGRQAEAELRAEQQKERGQQEQEVMVNQRTLA